MGVRAHAKNPIAQIAHLVFADKQANAQKTKRAIFANARTNEPTIKSKFDD